MSVVAGELSHVATKSIYGHSPAGNEFEVMWMLPRSNLGEYENAAPSTVSTSPRRSGGGGVRTAAELVPLAVGADPNADPGDE